MRMAIRYEDNHDPPGARTVHRGASGERGSLDQRVGARHDPDQSFSMGRPVRPVETGGQIQDRAGWSPQFAPLDANRRVASGRTARFYGRPTGGCRLAFVVVWRRTPTLIGLSHSGEDNTTIANLSTGARRVGGADSAAGRAFRRRQLPFPSMSGLVLALRGFGAWRLVYRRRVVCRGAGGGRCKSQADTFHPRQFARGVQPPGRGARIGAIRFTSETGAGAPKRALARLALPLTE